MTLLNILLLMAPGADGSQGSLLPTFIFMGAIFLVMYFFMIRPQTKKAQEQKNFLDELKKGDRVVTISGIHGKITSIDGNSLMLEIDADVKVKIEKAGISLDYTKTAYGNNDKAAEKTKEQVKETN
jgi:preprotein translocase subunit YajC